MRPRKQDFKLTKFDVMGKTQNTYCKQMLENKLLKMYPIQVGILKNESGCTGTSPC